jgi:hypothetical protein
VDLETYLRQQEYARQEDPSYIPPPMIVGMPPVGGASEDPAAADETERERELLDRLDQLRTSNVRLSKQLIAAKASEAEKVEAIYRAAKDVLLTLDIERAPRVEPKPSQGGDSEVAVVVLSDWQLAKVTPDYNSQVCAERIDRLADKLIRLTDIQRADHPIEELRLWCLGDMVEGELIFPGQSHLIDASLYQQVCKDGVKIGTDFIRKVAPHFKHLTVEAVIGNHGRIGGRASRDYDPETNADRMLYRIWELVMSAANEDVQFKIPDGGRERNWYHVSDIGGYKTLLFHGDQMRGTSGLPWYGFFKKISGWKNGAIPGGFDDAYCGHWHQPTRLTINKSTVRVAGSTESYNTYAAEQLAAVGRPSQPVMFVKPGVGPTAEYCVWLD